MNALHASRLAAAILGLVSLVAAIGSVALGVIRGHGGLVAAACLMAGVCLSCWLWWREVVHPGRSMLDHFVAATFSMAAGLALYLNVTWALWAAGMPVDVATLRDDRMGEHYWLGPLALAYAVACYATLRRSSAKR